MSLKLKQRPKDMVGPTLGGIAVLVLTILSPTPFNVAVTALVVVGVIVYWAMAVTW